MSRSAKVTAKQAQSTSAEDGNNTSTAPELNLEDFDLKGAKEIASVRYKKNWLYMNEIIGSIPPPTNCLYNEKEKGALSVEDLNAHITNQNGLLQEEKKRLQIIDEELRKEALTFRKTLSALEELKDPSKLPENLMI